MALERSCSSPITGRDGPENLNDESEQAGGEPGEKEQNFSSSCAAIFSFGIAFCPVQRRVDRFHLLRKGRIRQGLAALGVRERLGDIRFGLLAAVAQAGKSHETKQPSGSGRRRVLLDVPHRRERVAADVRVLDAEEAARVSQPKNIEARIWLELHVPQFVDDVIDTLNEVVPVPDHGTHRHLPDSRNGLMAPFAS